MTADIGWCWTGTVPELLVIEPERFKTPKIVNKVEEDVWLVYPWENVGEYHA